MKHNFRNFRTTCSLDVDPPVLWAQATCCNAKQTTKMGQAVHNQNTTPPLLQCRVKQSSTPSCPSFAVCNLQKRCCDSSCATKPSLDPSMLCHSQKSPNHQPSQIDQCNKSRPSMSTPAHHASHISRSLLQCGHVCTIHVQHWRWSLPAQPSLQAHTCQGAGGGHRSS